MQNNKITITAVAKEANVSKTTVSRYLNGKYEFMSEETKDKIEKVIRRLEYYPSSIARGLKSKKSGLIGVLVSDIGSTFSSILVKGVNEVCVKEGYQLIIANTDNNYEKEKDYIEAMLSSQVEGIIINTTGKNDRYLLALKEKGIHIVLADRIIYENSIDSITTNNKEMTTKAVKLMYKNGFEVVAFFSEDLETSSSRKVRYQAFLEVSKAYCENPGSLVYLVDNEIDTLKTQILEFVDKYKNLKKSILIVNGVTMFNFLKVVKRLNLRIPEDLGVCSFDDWGWGELIGTGITVISQPSYEVGLKSAEILIGRIKGTIDSDKSVYFELNAHIIQRASTEI